MHTHIYTYIYIYPLPTREPFIPRANSVNRPNLNPWTEQLTQLRDSVLIDKAMGNVERIKTQSAKPSTVHFAAGYS